MLLGVIALLVGIILGYIIGVLRATKKPIGEIHVVEDEGTPYLYLSLDKPVQSFITQPQVVMTVKIDDYNSQ